jgi:hypothetical protein
MDVIEIGMYIDGYGIVDKNECGSRATVMTQFTF